MLNFEMTWLVLLTLVLVPLVGTYVYRSIPSYEDEVDWKYLRYLVRRGVTLIKLRLVSPFVPIARLAHKLARRKSAQRAFNQAHAKKGVPQLK